MSVCGVDSLLSSRTDQENPPWQPAVDHSIHRAVEGEGEGEWNRGWEGEGERGRGRASGSACSSAERWALFTPQSRPLGVVLWRR